MELGTCDLLKAYGFHKSVVVSISNTSSYSIHDSFSVLLSSYDDSEAKIDCRSSML